MLLLTLALAGLGCAGQDAAGPTSGVRFVIDAPLCSAVIPVDFFLDHAMLGSDTFRVQLQPERLVSRRFDAPSGTHSVGARVPGGFAWPDTPVTLPAGAVFEDTLPFYCS